MVSPSRRPSSLPSSTAATRASTASPCGSGRFAESARQQQPGHRAEDQGRGPPAAGRGRRPAGPASTAAAFAHCARSTRYARVDPMLPCYQAELGTGRLTGANENRRALKLVNGNRATTGGLSATKAEGRREFGGLMSNCQGATRCERFANYRGCSRLCSSSPCTVHRRTRSRTSR